jgi:hypothetical protein
VGVYSFGRGYGYGDSHCVVAMSNEPLVTLEVRLSRVIDEDGRMAIRIQTPQTYNSVEVLGLLEAAKCHIFKGMRDFDE